VNPLSFFDCAPSTRRPSGWKENKHLCLVSHHANTKTHAKPVFERIKLPAGISDLDTGLTDMKRDDFAHYMD
jgi:hypothetical protein